jgi:hypothetical protein
MPGFGNKSLDVKRNIVEVQLFTKGEGGPLRPFSVANKYTNRGSFMPSIIFGIHCLKLCGIESFKIMYKCALGHIFSFMTPIFIKKLYPKDKLPIST